MSFFGEKCNKCEYFPNYTLKKMCDDCRDNKNKIYDELEKEYAKKGKDVPPHLEPDFFEGWS